MSDSESMSFQDSITLSDLEDQGDSDQDGGEMGENEDKNVTLIRLVREKDFLFTKSDRRHNERHTTERAWAKIGAELGWSKDGKSFHILRKPLL